MPVSDAEFRQLEERLYRYRVELQALRLVHNDILARLLVIEPQVSALARKDEIADAVAERLSSERRLILSTAQKFGAAFMAGLVIADFARSWL